VREKEEREGVVCGNETLKRMNAEEGKDPFILGEKKKKPPEEKMMKRRL